MTYLKFVLINALVSVLAVSGAMAVEPSTVSDGELLLTAMMLFWVAFAVSIWFIVAVGCWYVAKKKNLSGPLWGILGLFFGIFAILFLAMTPAQPASEIV